MVWRYVTWFEISHKIWLKAVSPLYARIKKKQMRKFFEHFINITFSTFCMSSASSSGILRPLRCLPTADDIMDSVSCTARRVSVSSWLSASNSLLSRDMSAAISCGTRWAIFPIARYTRPRNFRSWSTSYGQIRLVIHRKWKESCGQTLWSALLRRDRLPIPWLLS